MILKNLAIAVLIILTGLAGTRAGLSADISTAIYVREDRGGVLIDYALRVLEIKRDGTPVMISGDCASACTLLLSLPPEQLCITRDASFGFHLPYGTSARGNRFAATYLRQAYPAWTQMWIANRGGLSKRMKTMDYEFASNFLQTCGEVNSRRLASRKAGDYLSIY